MFDLLRLIMFESIISTAIGRCFNATKFASNASSIVLQCAHTNTFSLGGRGTKFNLASVIIPRVPSEPAINSHKLK